MNEHAPAETGTEVTAFSVSAPELIYKSREIADDLLARMKEAVEAEPVDLTTVKGRKAVRSLAHKVARTKTAIDKAGLALTEQQRAEIKAVNAERSRVVEKLQEMQDAILKPVDEYEAAEAARKAALEERMAVFDLGRVNMGCTAEDIQAVVTELEDIDTSVGFEDLAERAEVKRNAALMLFRSHLAIAEQREANERELETLRAAAAEAEAREKARQDEIDRRDAEIARQARELEQAKEAAAKAEADRIAAAEKAESDRIAAEAKAEEDRIAKIEAEKKAEADRIAAEKKAKADRAAEAKAAEEEKQREALRAEAEKEARERNRAKIVGEITDDVTPLMSGTPESMTAALIAGEVRHITVEI